MKEIIYNYDNLREDEANNVIKRAKALIVNSKDEILFGYADKTYQFVGGHVEDNESYQECLSREIKEESGIELTFDDIKPFLVIKYYSRNYPHEGDNTTTINNYFIVRTDMKPDFDNRNLTDYEIKSGYTVKYIHKDMVLSLLQGSLVYASKRNPVLDTIEAVEEFIKISSDNTTREEWR